MQWKPRPVCLWKLFSDMGRGKSITICSHEYNLVWLKKDLAPLTSLYIYNDVFSPNADLHDTTFAKNCRAQHVYNLNSWIVLCKSSTQLTFNNVA
jgi:hypothetical protein